MMVTPLALDTLFRPFNFKGLTLPNRVVMSPMTRSHSPGGVATEDVAAYYRRLTDNDPRVRLAAAKAWSVWEASTLSLLQDVERIRNFGADAYALTFARIECHYFINGGFFASDDQLLADAGRLQGIPGTIVHGRYDVVTPVKNAWDLKRVWPTADLRIVADAGHAMSETGIAHELVSATRRHRRLSGT